MCGRYVSVSSPAILADRFGVDEVRISESEADYNVAPRAEMPVVAVSRGRRVLDKVRWGLVPSWAKSLSIGDRQINARADSVATKAAYKRAFVKRRAIVPADGFYEWEKLDGGKRKQPWFIRRRDGEPLAFAGLWEIWHDPNEGDDAPRIRTFTIITTDANELLKPLHDRMPVVLPESEWDRWLDPTNQDVDALQKLLVPAPDDDFEAWPVSMLVNKADNNGPELLDPPGDDSGAERSVESTHGQGDDSGAERSVESTHGQGDDSGAERSVESTHGQGDDSGAERSVESTHGQGDDSGEERSVESTQ